MVEANKIVGKFTIQPIEHLLLCLLRFSDIFTLLLLLLLTLFLPLLSMLAGQTLFEIENSRSFNHVFLDRVLIFDVCFPLVHIAVVGLREGELPANELPVRQVVDDVANDVPVARGELVL